MNTQSFVVSANNILDTVAFIQSKISSDVDPKHLITLNQKTNSFLINSKIKDFRIIQLQYKNTKELYAKHNLPELEFKEYKIFYKTAELQKRIDDYIDFFSSNQNKSTEQIFIAIDQIKQACQNKLLLKLNYTYVKKINILIQNLRKTIKNLHQAKKVKLNLEISNLVDKHLSKLIGYSDNLEVQNIIVEIKPITSNFDIEQINFTSSKNKTAFEKKSLILKNLHIKKLTIEEYLYGFNGLISFELYYPDNHPDFDFLTKSRKPLLLDIQIEDTFQFTKKGSQTEYHKKLSRFVAIGNIENEVDIQTNCHHDMDLDKNDKAPSLKKFNVTFSDPLKTLWSVHKPTYVDFNKTLDDIFKDNFFFENLISFESSKSELLKNRFSQAFISTIDRNFYDFFIEQLQKNNCTLKYFCNKKDGKATYYIFDNITDDLKQKIKNSDQDIKDTLSEYDANCFQTQQLKKQNLNFGIKKSLIIPDINLKNNKKIAVAPNDNSKMFSSIEESIISPISYFQKQDSKNNTAKDNPYVLKLISRNTLPFLDSDMSLSKLKSDGKLLTGEDFYIYKRSLIFERSAYSSNQLYENLDSQHYKSNADEDAYEKITFCDFPKLTHDNRITYQIKDYESLKAEYPNYTSFQKFNITGKVTIGENVNEDSKKAYKFFKNYKPEESSISEFQESSEKGSQVFFNSKASLFYALEIPKEIINSKNSGKPIIYIPVKININSANNQFMPLKNGDIIILEIQSIEQCEIMQSISNTALSTDKAQKILLQRQLLGAKENFEVAYTQTGTDETYSLRQQNKKSENAVLINNENGIFLRHKVKGN